MLTRHISSATRFWTYGIFSGISKHPKLSKLNGAFQCLSFYFSTKFTISNIDEELQIWFIARTATKLKKQREPTHWKVALGQPRFHVPEGLEMAVSRNFPRKIYYNLKISISWLEPLTKFTCKIWAKSVNLPVCRFLIWLHSYGVSLLIKQHQDKNDHNTTMIINSCRNITITNTATSVRANSSVRSWEIPSFPYVQKKAWKARWEFWDFVVSQLSQPFSQISLYVQNSWERLEKLGKIGKIFRFPCFPSFPGNFAYSKNLHIQQPSNLGTYRLKFGI